MPHMPRKSPTREKQETAELQAEIAELKDHVRLLVDAIDELREQLQWIACNRLPEREPPRTSPVLKRMVADPSADDWGDHLEIVYGEPEPAAEKPAPEPVASPSQPAPSANPGCPAGQLF